MRKLEAEGSTEAMTAHMRLTMVKELPARLDWKSERALLQSVKMVTNVERPAIVLNCSRMREMNISTIHFLLCCLEEAMKRNGDVRLAGLSHQAMESLRCLGVDRLFRIFETSEQAVRSFQRRAAFVSPFVDTTAAMPAENAA